jgi:hypothetical protein
VPLTIIAVSCRHIIAPLKSGVNKLAVHAGTGHKGGETQRLTATCPTETIKAIKVILYFSDIEHGKVQKVLKDLDLEKRPDVVLINARPETKVSDSKATCSD